MILRARQREDLDPYEGFGAKKLGKRAREWVRYGNYADKMKKRSLFIA
jgi:hypothetical protein